MAYVAVRGGQEAIEASLDLREKQRRQARGALRALRDQIMSEASLYDVEAADLAIAQSEGSPEEAVFLLRAFRSTLGRKGYSEAASGGQMFVQRRISAAFKNIPGGQILGSSPDYSHRLLDFSLLEETEHAEADLQAWLARYDQRVEERLTDGDSDRGEPPVQLGALPKVVDFLRAQGLMSEIPAPSTEVQDITRQGLRFPSSRSARLQVLSRGQTGALTAFGYASLRGWGDVVVHPTVCELRVGLLPVYLPPQGGEHDRNDDSQPDAPEEPAFTRGHSGEDSYYIGDVTMTEVESLMPVSRQNSDGSHSLSFDLGHGACFGQNETKAIAISIVEYNLEHADPANPSSDEEFVLLHIDSVEATGFISHLKLPHYVTFQSVLNSLRKTRSAASTASEAVEPAASQQSTSGTAAKAQRTTQESP